MQQNVSGQKLPLQFECPPPENLLHVQALLNVSVYLHFSQNDSSFSFNFILAKG